MKRLLSVAMASAALGLAQPAPAEPVAVDSGGKWIRLTDEAAPERKSRLIVYTTMATWCVACKTELPQLHHLRNVFTPEEVAMFGLPYDEKEGPELLMSWVKANGAPYRMITDFSRSNIASIKAMVMKALRIDAVPTTIVTDAGGKVLLLRSGPPSVSELRELLWLAGKSTRK